MCVYMCISTHIYVYICVYAHTHVFYHQLIRKKAADNEMKRKKINKK